MNITEINNTEAVSLQPPTFICDTIIRYVPLPWPRMASYIVITGPSRSGKTSLLVNLLTNKKLYNRAFENVIVVMPTHSITSLKRNIFEGLPPEKIFHELTLESIQNIYSQIMEYASDEENTLLILDDVTSNLKNPELLKFLNMLVCNRRHLRLTLVMLVQFYNSIPLSNRKTITHLVMFKSKNNAEKETVREELTPFNRDDFNVLLRYVFDKPFEYLLIDRDNDKMYKKFNELVITHNTDVT